jgi:hypothetical protein
MRLLAAAAAAALAFLGVHAASAGDVVRTDQTWTCTGPVDLDLLQVSIPAGPRQDAVHLRPGCTGRIGRLEVTQRSGDGVKVAEGVHDLTVEGGSIRCLDKSPRVHQDGIQAMGGMNITFHGLSIDCGRRDTRKINSNLFIKQGKHSTLPPTDVVCEQCSFGAWAAHTVSVQTSIRSGVVNSTLCVARFPRLTLDVGSGAVEPRVSDNQVRQCGPGLLALEPGPRTVDFGKTLQLNGLFLGRLGGAPIQALVHQHGRRRWVVSRTTTSRPAGRFTIVLRPLIGETVRLRSGTLRGPSITVRVRPRVTLKRDGGTLVAQVRAWRSYAGRAVVLQALRGGRWSAVQQAELDRHGRAELQPSLRHVQVRAAVAPAPGYVSGTSDPVRLS